MANAYRCDICGEYFDTFTYVNGKRNRIARPAHSATEYYDLCKNCQEKLEAFVKNDFKNVKIEEANLYEIIKLRDYKIGDYVPNKGYIVEILSNPEKTEFSFLYSDTPIEVS